MKRKNNNEILTFIYEDKYENEGLSLNKNKIFTFSFKKNKYLRSGYTTCSTMMCKFIESRLIEGDDFYHSCLDAYEKEFDRIPSRHEVTDFALDHLGDIVYNVFADYIENYTFSFSDESYIETVIDLVATTINSAILDIAKYDTKMISEGVTISYNEYFKFMDDMLVHASYTVSILTSEKCKLEITREE